MSINEAEKKETGADLIVYGKIFTSENDQIVEAFAVKDGRYVYAGDRKGAEAFIEDGRTEILDYTGKGLVMPACGNGHAHYSMGYALHSVGTIVSAGADVTRFLTEIVPGAVRKQERPGQRLYSVSDGSIQFSRIICPPVSSWTQYAVIFPYTLQMRKDTRVWRTLFVWSGQAS